MSSISLNPALVDLRAALANLLAVIDQTVDSDALECDPESSPDALAQPKKKEPYWDATGIDWPQIGGRDFVPVQRTLFDAAEYRARYKPGVELACFAAHCPGAGALAKAIGMPLLSLATCDASGLNACMRAYKCEAHGACYSREGALITDREPWTDWQPAFLRPQIGPSPQGPVSVGARTINVVLPASFSSAEFEASFTNEIRKGAIDAWVATPDGAAHCNLRGLDPDMFRRKTAAPNAEGARPIRDLTVFRQSTDADRVIAIIERLVLRHLGIVA